MIELIEFERVIRCHGWYFLHLVLFFYLIHLLIPRFHNSLFSHNLKSFGNNFFSPTPAIFCLFLYLHTHTIIAKCASTKNSKIEIEIGELQRDLEKLNCRTLSARASMEQILQSKKKLSARSLQRFKSKWNSASETSIYSPHTVAYSQEFFRELWRKKSSMCAESFEQFLIFFLLMWKLEKFERLKESH